MDRRKILIALPIVLSLLVAGFGAYRQIDARHSPSRADLGPVRAFAPAPLTVSLSTQSGRGLAVLGGSTFVAANVAGATISRVRLFDGATFIGEQQFSPAKKNRASVRFEWPATQTGAHVLHAEAVGATSDQVGHSAPLRITVEQGAVAGAVIRPAATTSTPTGASSAPATSPKISVSLDGCRATVTSSQDLAVYEASGGSAGFTSRGQVKPGSPLRTDDLPPGPHVFVAGPSGKPANSAPVAVTAPDSCLKDAWSGPAALLDGELTLPQPEPQVWVYLGVDDQPFQRIPAVGTVGAPFGSADIAHLMPSVRGSKVRMEIWKPGATASAPATMVARSETTAANPNALADLLGGSPAVSLSGPTAANPIELGKTDTSVTFSWQTESAIPTGVVWQVLGRPLVASDHNTAPPVLLATGTSASGSGSGIVLSGQGGSFSVPAELLLAGRPKSGPVNLADVLQKPPTPSISELTKPGSSFGTTPLRKPTTNSIPTLDAGIVPIPIGDVYVRVLPINGQSVVGDASNTVAVTLPPLDGVAGFTDPVVSFDPGRAANYALSGCVRITGTPSVAPGAIVASIYRTDGTYCARDFAGKGGGCQGWCQVTADLTSVVGFVAKAWDYIAQAYNTVVDTVVTVIAKFNPFCLTASVASAISESPYANSASKGCEAVGAVVGSVVVSVVLTSFGLPARLPTSDQVAGIAEGDLTQIAVAYLESMGVPCSQMKVDATTAAAVEKSGAPVPSGVKAADGSVDVCAAMVGQAVGAIRDQIKKAADAEVANVSGLPIPPEPQQMVLEPRSMYHGATVQISARPIDANVATTARCLVQAHGSVPSWNVGGLEGTKVRQIGLGSGFVAFSPFGALAGKPWRATLSMPPIDDLYESEKISVQLSSSCFASGTLHQIAPTQLGPPLGRWHPGEPD